MRWAILASCLCAAVSAADAYRIKAMQEQADGLHTAWGTAFVFGGRLITALHTLENKSDLQVEIDGKWVKAELVLEDRESDLAVLKVAQELKSLERGTARVGDAVQVASSVQGQPVKVLAATLRRTYMVECAEADMGSSGSPVLKDGKVIGMVVSRRSATSKEYRIAAIDDIEATIRERLAK